jgi:hypothetical protein
MSGSLPTTPVGAASAVDDEVAATGDRR